MFTSNFACPRLCRPIVWPVWEELSFQPWAQVSTHNFSICVSYVYIYICTEIWHQAAGDTSIRAWTSWHNQQAFENLEIDYCNVCVQARISWPVFPLVSCRFLHESPPFSRLKIPTDKAKTPKKQKSCDIEVSMHRPKAVLPWLQHRLFAWKTVAIAIEVRDGLGSRDSGRWSWRK